MARSFNPRTEPGFQHARFQTRFNLHVKLAAAALSRFAQSSRRRTGDAVVTRAVRRVQPSLWNGTSITQATTKIGEAQSEVARWALLAVYSALDSYVCGATAEWDRKAHRDSRETARAKRAAEQDDEQADDLLTELARRLGSTSVVDSGQLTVLRYFRAMRNCVAHRDGRASLALETQAKDVLLTAAWTNLTDATRKGRLPELPRFRAGEQIALDFTHAILASAVARAVVVDLDPLLCKHLGREGLVLMATTHILEVESDSPRLRNGRSAEGALAWVLTNRYGYSELNASAVRSVLSRHRKVRQAVERTFAETLQSGLAPQT